MHDIPIDHHVMLVKPPWISSFTGDIQFVIELPSGNGNQTWLTGRTPFCSMKLPAINLHVNIQFGNFPAMSDDTGWFYHTYDLSLLLLWIIIPMISALFNSILQGLERESFDSSDPSASRGFWIVLDEHETFKSDWLRLVCQAQPRHNQWFLRCARDHACWRLQDSRMFCRLSRFQVRPLAKSSLGIIIIISIPHMIYNIYIISYKLYLYFILYIIIFFPHDINLGPCKPRQGAVDWVMESVSHCSRLPRLPASEITEIGSNLGIQLTQWYVGIQAAKRGINLKWGFDRIYGYPGYPRKKMEVTNIVTKWSGMGISPAIWI